MKYIVVGLGNFGASLSQKLTAMGHEVIGIDKDMDKVHFFKDKISTTIAMNATDEETVVGLPLHDVDIVIIAIGEDQGANIMSTAIFKNHQVKRLISRAMSPLHENVLTAIGVDEIVYPEEETAERWAKKLCLRNVVESFQLSSDYSIIEAKLPDEYAGRTVDEVGFRSKYNLVMLTTIRQREASSIFGQTRTYAKVHGVANPTLKLEEDDILVLYGANKDLQSFLKKSID